MPNWKKVIISGSDAALNSLEVTSHLTASGLIYPTVDGTDGQAITTDAAGNLTFGNPGFADEAEKVTFAVQNGETFTLAKGTPVHITSTTNGTSIVVAASASVASKMPSHGILNQQLTAGSDGFATILGQITGVDTSAFSSGDTVYVGPFGGYTNIKPTGSTNLIQNLGVVKKVDASNGTGEIFGSGRSNDVPNLPIGKIWVGAADYTVTSSVVHLDEPNSRLGINTNNPTQALDVLGSANITGSLIVSGSGVDLTVEGDVIITDGNRLNLKSAGGTYTGYIEKDSYDATVSLGLNTTFTGARRIYINDGTNQRWEFGGNTTGASDNIIAPGGGYSGSAVYAGHAGNIGFFTRGSTVAANVMQLFDRTDNSNHGVKLIYQSGGSYSDGLMLDNTGNVGINNTSPSARLQVKGSGTTSATTALLVENSSGTDLLKITDDGFIVGTSTVKFGQGLHIERSGPSINFKTTDNAVASGLTFQNSGGSTTARIYHTPDTGKIDFWPSNGGSKMNLTTDGLELTGSLTISGSSADLTVTGNVGIGTSSPSTKFHLVGGIARFDNASSNYLEIDGSNSGTNNAVISNRFNQLQLVTNTGGGDPHIALLPATGGNVGIGTTTPSTKLDIKGSGTTDATTALLAQDSSGTELIKVYDDGITAFGEYSRGTGVQSDDYITTAGRVRAGGGITFRPPTVNDNTWYGFDHSSNFLNVRVGGTTAKFGASGANTNDSFYVSTGFNPSSGTTDKSFVRIESNNQSGAGYSGDVYALKIDHSLGSKSGTGNDYGVYQGNSSAYNYFNGNVGIGNSIPPEKLTVEGNISGSGNLNVDGDFTMAGGTLDTAGGIIDTNGGDIDTNGGNINIGTGGLNGTIPGSTVDVDVITATIKNFVIDHPSEEKAGYKLRHSSLEGPEIGVYFRGKSTTNIINLPDYWKDLVDEDSITVNLTSFGSPCQHYIEDIKDNQIIIGCACGTPNYHFTVYGERKDVDRLIVEYKEETYL